MYSKCSYETEDSLSVKSLISLAVVTQKIFSNFIIATKTIKALNFSNAHACMQIHINTFIGTAAASWIL